MVSKEHLEKFYEFEKSGKLNVVVFILFLFPAMPKDVFTYLVPFDQYAYAYVFDLWRPLVEFRVYWYRPTLLRDLPEGQVTMFIIFGVAAAIALVCLIFRNRIMRVLGTAKAFRERDKSEKIRANAR